MRGADAKSPRAACCGSIGRMMSSARKQPDTTDIDRYRREQSSAYLKRIRAAKRHIAALNAEVEEHRALASGLKGIDYTQAAVRTSPTADAMSDAVAKLLDVVEQRIGLIREYAGMLDACGRALSEMNDTYADILRYRYICDYRWDRIAATLCYSEQRLYELHGQALSEFYLHMPTNERDPLPKAL